MGSTDNAAASTKLPRHSRENGNPARQSEGLCPRVRGDDGMNEDILPFPQGEGRGEGHRNIKFIVDIHKFRRNIW